MLSRVEKRTGLNTIDTEYSVNRTFSVISGLICKRGGTVYITLVQMI